MMAQPEEPHPASVPTMPPSAAATQSWRVALPTLVFVLVLILVLFRDTAIAMVTIWYRAETFTHAFVVPPIVLWLVWRKRQELALMLPRPAFWVLLFVAGVALLWLLGDLVAVNSVTQLAFTALLVLAVPAVLGVQVARAITFPLAFLFFAVPIGEFLLPQLMDWTANFTIIALRLSGIPVYREGLQFIIPSGNWSVVEACSGVRYLIASFTVGTLFAYLNYQSTKRRVLFAIVSILVPVFANWMRAYMIVMLGHLSGNKLAVGVDHLVYGWVFFGIVIMLMFVIGAKWAEPERLAGSGATSLPVQPAVSPANGFWIVAVGLVIAIAFPTAAKWAIGRSVIPGTPVLAAPVALEAGWKTAEASSIDFKPAFENPSSEINASYSNAGKVVGLYLGYYRNQDYSHKLVSSNNVLVISSDLNWSRATGGERSVKLGEQAVATRTAELRRLRLGGADQPERLIAWQIYWVDGRLTASDYLAKVYSALYRLAGRGDESAVIIVYAARDNVGNNDATLEAFMAANYVRIDALLRQTRARR